MTDILIVIFKQYLNDCKNITHEPLVEPKNFLSPLHIKLGLIQIL